MTVNGLMQDMIDIPKNWRELLKEFQTPSVAKSMWQLANTLIPYITLWVLMYFSLSYSFWLTLLLAIPTAGFMVRIFIIAHDCGHGSFLKTSKMNAFIGSITSILCCSPYYYWKHDHAIHHSNSGNLDKRGNGDIWTMTVQEYLAAPKSTRVLYRIYRNPFVMFGIGALFVFVVQYRIPKSYMTAKDKKSVWRTNAAIALLLVVMYFTIGLKAFFLVQLPIWTIGATAGVWLFYVQHQFEGVYWGRNEVWNFEAGAVDGSSFYRLPKVLQWFTGNIGFHHVHHLSSKIPNYNLEKCHKAFPFLQEAKTLTLWSSLKCIKYRLWDEENQQLVGYKYLKQMAHPAR